MYSTAVSYGRYKRWEMAWGRPKNVNKKRSKLRSARNRGDGEPASMRLSDEKRMDALKSYVQSACNKVIGAWQVKKM